MANARDERTQKADGGVTPGKKGSDFKSSRMRTRGSTLKVSEMMETNEGEREDTPMIEALAMGDTSMRKLYALRAGQVKASAFCLARWCGGWSRCY